MSQMRGTSATGSLPIHFGFSFFFAYSSFGCFVKLRGEKAKLQEPSQFISNGNFVNI